MIGYLRDLLTTFWLVWSVVRHRGRTADRLRESLADAEYDLSRLRQSHAETQSFREAAEAENRQLRADLEVAKKEIEGVARAHDVLCRMLESQAALYTRKSQHPKP